MTKHRIPSLTTEKVRADWLGRAWRCSWGKRPWENRRGWSFAGAHRRAVKHLERRARRAAWRARQHAGSSPY